MSLTAELNVLRSAQDVLKDHARQELRAIMARLDPAGPDAVRDVLNEVLPALAVKYGDAAGAVAAEWFEATYDLEGVVIPDTLELGEVAASARWAVGDLYAGGTLGTVYTRAEGALLRHALYSSRDTIEASATRNRIGYARVLRGPTNCAFCVMAAGRGATYTSERAAGRVVGRGKDPLAATTKNRKLAKGIKTRGQGRRERPIGSRYHDHCNCDVIAIRDDSDWPADYDVERLERMYQDALQEATTDGLYGGKPGVGSEDGELNVMQAMRRLHGLK